MNYRNAGVSLVAMLCVVFFFFRQKTAYDMLRSLVGSEMCIRDSDVAAHKPLFDNVRLWDWRAFHDTVTQIQALRPYYVFNDTDVDLSLIHISEPTRLLSISYAVFCLKKKKNTPHNT